jgi:hypothetical protein
MDYQSYTGTSRKGKHTHSLESPTTDTFALHDPQSYPSTQLQLNYDTTGLSHPHQYQQLTPAISTVSMDATSPFQGTGMGSGVSEDGGQDATGAVSSSTSGNTQSAFITKLYTMLEEANVSLICWDVSGTYFTVHNPTGM